MKRINTIFCCVLVIALMFSSCGNKESKEEQVTKESFTTEKDETVNEGIFPNEEQMAKDIDTFGANIICLENGEYTLKTSSVKIYKAKKEHDQYLVYCTATQESDMFKANNNYAMVYNNYDIGGWVLDECYVEKVNMTPKTTIAEDEAQSYADGGYGYNSLECSELEKVSDTEYIYHYVGKYEYEYMDEVYNIEVTCIFDNECGWIINSDNVSVYNDWSKMYGTWIGDNPESSDWKYKIVVKEVDENVGVVKCDVDLEYPESSPKGDFGDILNGKNKLVKKNITAEILDEIEWFWDDGDEGLEYNAEIKKMHTYYSKSMERDESVTLELCWGKNVGMSKVLFDDGWGGLYFTYLTKE